MNDHKSEDKYSDRAKNKKKERKETGQRSPREKRDEGIFKERRALQ